MNRTYLSYNNIVSSLGFDSETVADQISKQISGLALINDPLLLSRPFPAASIASNVLQNAFAKLQTKVGYTRLEQMLLISVSKTLVQSKLVLTDRVGLIVSTTKGNIDVLDASSGFPEERSYLTALGAVLKEYFGFKTEPIVVSNACISGLLAVSIAKRMIQQRRFDQVVVVAGELLTAFTVSGFNAFQAYDFEPCRPYCKTRRGVNLGEVAVSVLVTNDASSLAPEAVRILGEASCNDANHISGPSRTGEGLFKSIQSALKEAALAPKAIDYISAHGTATPYNDDIEAIAFNRCELGTVPMNSLKGYFGHTLGAAGLLETVVGMHSLFRNTLFASKGFQEIGVSQPLNVIRETTHKHLATFLKTASGFGGSNSAAIFQKVKD